MIHWEMVSTWRSFNSLVKDVPLRFIKRSSVVPKTFLDLIKPAVRGWSQGRRRYWSWCQHGDEDLFKSCSECLGRGRQQHGLLIIMDHYVKCWSVGLSPPIPLSLFDETLLNITVLMLCQISGLSSQAFISHLKNWRNACLILVSGFNLWQNK